jgi:Uma2 family endonuclease
MSTLAVPRPVGSILLTGIRWQTYETLLADLRDRPIRLTYDRGKLEIMAPTFNHERSKRQIGRLVETLAEDSDVEILSGGLTTFRREELERGLEPDDCFYIANVPAVLDKLEIDLRIDPPPDLALEIDISSSSLDRMAIYAALRIPEVWRYDGYDLLVYHLARKSTYRRAERSAAFPHLNLKRFSEFIRQNVGLGHNSLVKQFRKWLRAESA